MSNFKSIRKFLLVTAGLFALIWISDHANARWNSNKVTLYKDVKDLPANYSVNDSSQLVWEAWGTPIVIDKDNITPPNLYIEDSVEKMHIMGIFLWALVLSILFFASMYIQSLVNARREEYRYT